MTDEELIAYVGEFREGLLDGKTNDGWCFAMCTALGSFLAVSCDMWLELHEGDYSDFNHFWLMLPDGRALDPTADQLGLGLPGVYIGEPTKHHQGGPWSET